MTRILFLTLFAFVTNVTVAKAETTVNSHVLRIIDSAKNLLCNKDTVAAIRQLELIEKTYPNDAHVLFTSKVLGDLYFMKGATDKALQSLYVALRCSVGPYVLVIIMLVTSYLIVFLLGEARLMFVFQLVKYLSGEIILTAACII